jgi:hypothetical protein
VSLRGLLIQQNSSFKPQTLVKQIVMLWLGCGLSPPELMLKFDGQCKGVGRWVL